jgi:hypothetical protein
MNTQPLTPQSAGITGPMNINAVITHLIEMTPGQRKQFAQIHMDDPMMLSAAKFVDNQVNKQAQSLAAQQTGAAPPPVNQQAVEQMTGSPMPEDTGIAQLPAENMPSEYAGGGIVAFADRGLVDTSPQYVGVGGGQGRRGAPGMGERAPVVQPRSTAPRAEAPAPPAASREAPYTVPQGPGLESILKGFQTAQGAPEDPFAEQGAEMGKSRDAIANTKIAGSIERGKGIETLLKGKEERIAGREARLKEQDTTDLNMSIINAGLAMMQSTGKGLAGIAEGAQKGVGQFAESMKLSELARQKIEEARDAHDDLRFNLNNMSSKEIEAAKLSLEEGKIITTSETLARLKDNLGIKDARATALFGAYINQVTGDKQIAASSYEAERSRTHAASQTDKSIAASAAQSALERSARSGDAAASRALQERLASRPGETQRLYASLSPTGNVREGYEFAMQQRGEGALDKAKLVEAKDWLNNMMNNPAMNRNADPVLWQQAKDVMSRSLAASPPSAVRNPAGPVYAP